MFVFELNNVRIEFYSRFVFKVGHGWSLAVRVTFKFIDFVHYNMQLLYRSLWYVVGRQNLKIFLNRVYPKNIWEPLRYAMESCNTRGKNVIATNS